MGYITEQQPNTGSYVQTTSVWDVSILYDVEINSPEFRELIVRLYQQTNNIALSLNTKDSAFYVDQVFQTGQQWFNPTDPDPLKLRPAFRKVINMGALAAGANTVAHGLTLTGSTITFTKIQGAASNTATNNYVPLPHANGGATDIIVTVNATNVIVTNNSGSLFTNAYIILEYLAS